MCDPADSSQLKSWLFTEEDLYLSRARANRVARKYLTEKKKTTNGGDDDGCGVGGAKTTSSSANNPPVECFARDFHKKKEEYSKEDDGPWQTEASADGGGDGNEYLTPEEECLLVSFYTSKIPSLIGPMAQVPRLRRESKVPATAAMLLRRFYLSNSVMIHDPKTSKCCNIVF
jgi:cyclin H